jgi:hypothetical protein
LHLALCESDSRMPALTPTAVGLSPLASAAVMNATTAADTNTGEQLPKVHSLHKVPLVQ